jgi:dihydroorotase
MKLLVRGGRVVDPAQSLDALRDLLIENGTIAQIGEHLEDAGARVIDVVGAIVAPGFIDMHVHLREPGQTRKETIASGSAAAVAGGFTAVACMPNTDPALDSATIVGEVVRRAQAAALARVYPIGAITRGRLGVELAPYHLLRDAGCVAFSDDGATVASARVLRNAACYARDLSGPFISHCEDADLKGDAVMNEGVHSARLGLEGSPGLAEDVIVARDLLIAEDTAKDWHIAHVSTARSLDLLRWARARGVRATCEVTPHHLYFLDDRFEHYRADGKVNPPVAQRCPGRFQRLGNCTRRVCGCRSKAPARTFCCAALDQPGPHPGRPRRHACAGTSRRRDRLRGPRVDGRRARVPFAG